MIDNFHSYFRGVLIDNGMSANDADYTSRQCINAVRKDMIAGAAIAGVVGTFTAHLGTVPMALVAAAGAGIGSFLSDECNPLREAMMNKMNRELSTLFE